MAAHAVGVLAIDDEAASEQTKLLIRSKCTDMPWSDDGRRCMVASTDMDSYATCSREERIRRGDDMGGPSCDEVVRAREERMPFSTEQNRDDHFIFCRLMSREVKECILAIPPDESDPAYWEQYAVCRAKDPS